MTPGGTNLSSIQHVVVLQEIQAELVSRQFPAGRSAIPGTAGPAPVTDAALASYIRANA